MNARFAAPLVTFLVCKSAAAWALPPCAGKVELANARFASLETRTGALRLAGGAIVHLEGIRLPGGTADRAPESYAANALATIASISRLGAMTLAVTPPKLDRHRRLRAQVFVGEHWLQAELLGRGLARVETAPDRTDCASELLAVEAQARQEKRGLWAWPGYAIRSPSSVRRDVGTFQIVEGTVLDATVKNGRAYLNFGEDWRTDFTATIDPDDRPNFRRSGVDPRSYSGQTIRLRGWVQWHYGPEIEVPNPQNIVVIK